MKTNTLRISETNTLFYSRVSAGTCNFTSVGTHPVTLVTIKNNSPAACSHCPKALLCKCSIRVSVPECGRPISSFRTYKNDQEVHCTVIYRHI